MLANEGKLLCVGWQTYTTPPRLPCAVDLMEEVVSEGEGEGSGRAGKKGGSKGRKRKQQASPAAAVS